MAHSAFPTASDLSTYVSGLNLFDSSELAAVLARLNLTDKAAAAAQAFQEQAGWFPFITDGSDVSRRFDPPGPNSGHGGIWDVRGGKWVLNLRAGLSGTPAPVIVMGYSASSTNPQAGTTLVAEDDYWLLPEEAPLMSKPYTHVEFAVSMWGAPRSIRVTGRFGYGANVPEDAWQAVLQYGASMAWPDLAVNLSLGLLSYTEAGVTETSGPKALADYNEQWQANFQRAVNRYQRIAL